MDVMVLDFSNAFMTIPLDEREKPFNCSIVPDGLRRTRAPLEPDEPPEGTFIIWNVLGFGGRANPRVFARVASAVMRLTQSLWTPSEDDTMA